MLTFIDSWERVPFDLKNKRAECVFVLPLNQKQYCEQRYCQKNETDLNVDS